MGTEAISFSSSDITALQNDVNELKNKLNALIAEFNKCSDDTTTNKGKIDDLLDKISDGYTASGGNAGGATTDSILTRMQRLDEDFTELEIKFKTHMEGTYLAQHSGSHSSGRSAGGSTNTPGELYALTALTGTGADTSVNANDASVTAEYGTGGSVVTLGSKGEIKARKLARQTLNRLRK